MNTIKLSRLFFLVLLFATSARAQAPDSLAGKIFRDHLLLTTVRTSSEATLKLGADSRYATLLTGTGGALILSAPYRIFLRDPAADGGYTYQRTGASAATLTLRPDDAGTAPVVYELTFTSATAGTLGASATFSLTDPSAAVPLANLSLRGNVAAGRPLIAGFVVGGTQEREVLIRVVGPTLSNFNVSGAWADPDFALYSGASLASFEQIHYSDWSVSPNSNVGSPATAFQKIFALVGAFGLPVGSKDAAQIARLAPGAYTIVCAAPAGDAGGETLIEVYTLP